MAENKIHFKTAKKRASYTKKETQAAENRAKSGRGKPEILSSKTIKTKFKSRVDGHKIDPD